MVKKMLVNAAKYTSARIVPPVNAGWEKRCGGTSGDDPRRARNRSQSAKTTSRTTPPASERYVQSGQPWS